VQLASGDQRPGRTIVVIAALVVALGLAWKPIASVIL
jgi:hypothetical protein